MMCPFGKTKEGFETQWGVNHLGHALLCRLMLPQLRATSGRIVLVSSVAHVFVQRAPHARDNVPDSYDPVRAYGSSKLANILYARALQRWLHSSGDQIIVMSLHPGAVNTPLMYVQGTRVQRLGCCTDDAAPFPGDICQALCHGWCGFSGCCSSRHLGKAPPRRCSAAHTLM